MFNKKGIVVLQDTAEAIPHKSGKSRPTMVSKEMQLLCLFFPVPVGLFVPSSPR